MIEPSKQRSYAQPTLRVAVASRDGSPWLRALIGGLAFLALLFAPGLLRVHAAEVISPPPGFGQPPPVTAFGPMPYVHARSGLTFTRQPVSRICRVGDGWREICQLRQEEPIGADCGCPPAAAGLPYRTGGVARW